MYFVYIIECADHSLYTGITTDVLRRFSEHQKGLGGHYTASRGVLRVLYVEKQKDRSLALRREVVIKKMKRAEKLQLIKSRS